MNWYLTVLQQYAVFSGRARRKEYWMFILINAIIAAAISMVDGMLSTVDLGLIYSLVVLIPTIAVTVRRLHDTDRSGWWILISLIPLVGGIVLLVFMAIDGTPGKNQYGSNPKT